MTIKQHADGRCNQARDKQAPGKCTEHELGRQVQIALDTGAMIVNA